MIYFDTTNEYVARTSGMAPITGDYTALFWWNHAASPVGDYRTVFLLVDDPLGPYSDYIWLGQLEADAKLTLQVSLGGVVTQVQTSAAAAINVSEPVGYRRSGNDHELWYNGILVGSVTVDMSTATIDQLYLGSDVFTSDYPNQGFWYFREFESALTAEQIQAEWASPSAIETAFTDTPLQADLLDDSGNGHAWTLTGAGVITDTPSSRYYPTTKAVTAVVHGPLRGQWDGSINPHLPTAPVRQTFLASRFKGNAGTLNTITGKTNQEDFYDMNYLRWQTPPLAEQTLSGTFDMCFQVQATWISSGFPSNDSSACFKVTVYVCVGQTTEVRGYLLLDHVSATLFPGTSGAVWYQLDSPQALTPVDIQEGDSIMIEVGARCISSPTPAATYPPTTWSSMPIRGAGVNSTTAYYTDAVQGDTSTSRAPWFEFSQGLTEDPASIPEEPENQTCALATVAPTVPFDSGFIDTTQATSTSKAVWFKLTATQTGWMSAYAPGSNYRVGFNVYTDCAGSSATAVHNSSVFGSHRCQSFITWECTNGVDYYVRAKDDGSVALATAPDSGGVLRVVIENWTDPQEDDLYLPSGVRCVSLREGQFNTSCPMGETVTGVGIDYTLRPMIDIEDGSTNTSVRLLIGLFAYDLIEIVDLPTMSLGRTEVDYIADPLSVADEGHPSTLHVTAAGELYIAFFGNGFLYVAGEGSLPSIMNTVSDNADSPATKYLSATDGDNQSGAPYSATFINPSVEVCSPWAITMDEDNGIIYYTSGGFYVPVGGQEVRRWDLNSGQLSTFATIPADSGTTNPGLKGLQFLPGGGLLVCNGSHVVRLDDTGTIVQTFTPSISMDAQTLVDVKLTADGTQFWTVDEYSTRLFKFDIASGAEVATYQPYLHVSALTQMAIYQPDGAAPPPPPEAGTATLTVQKVLIGGGAQPFDFTTTGGLSPADFSLVDGAEQVYVDVPIGIYSVEETLPDGYVQLSVSVSNGDEPDAITLGDGDDVTVVFTNAVGSDEPNPAPSTLNATLLRMRRLRRTAYISEEEFRIFYHRLQIDAQVGMGLGGAVQLGTDPQMMVKWSDDGGNTWSNEHWVSLGRLGAFTWRAIWNRLGMGRTRLFEIVVSDPVAWRIVAAYLQLAKGNN